MRQMDSDCGTVFLAYLFFFQRQIVAVALSKAWRRPCSRENPFYSGICLQASMLLHSIDKLLFSLFDVISSKLGYLSPCSVVSFVWLLLIIIEYPSDWLEASAAGDMLQIVLESFFRTSARVRERWISHIKYDRIGTVSYSDRIPSLGLREPTCANVLYNINIREKCKGTKMNLFWYFVGKVVD